MREVLADIQSGRFAAALSDEAASDYPKLTKARREARALPVETAFRSLSDLKNG
jgi:ketol-acid reductoisomerase